MAVEAYHAAIVRTLLYENKNVKAYGSPASGIAAFISALRDAVNPEASVDQVGFKRNYIHRVPKSLPSKALSTRRAV